MRREPNESFEPLGCSGSSSPAAGPTLTLPDMPSGLERLLQFVLFEFDRDSHREWVVSKRVQPDEQAAVKVRPHDDRRVDASHVPAEWMLLFEPARLAAVANLQAVLIGRSALD